MKALITGGCGFIGRHLTKYLLDLGYEITIVDNFYPSSGYEYPFNWIKNISDSRIEINKEDCRKFFNRINSHKEVFDSIFHLAAVTYNKGYIDDLLLNQSIDAEFFRWLLRLNYNSKVHYASSAAVYGVMHQNSFELPPLRENWVEFDDEVFAQPDGIEGLTKLSSEYVAKQLKEKYSIDITCFRIFNLYGEDQPLHYAIPAMINQAIEANSITVHGNGKQQRDYMHIDDCIKGIVELKDKAGNHNAINISTGNATSLQLIANFINNNLPNNPDIKYDHTKHQGVLNRIGDTQLQKQLGFQHSISLDEGLKNMIAYYLNKNINSNI